MATSSLLERTRASFGAETGVSQGGLAKVSATLNAARAGGASLTELADAYETASALNLVAAQRELLDVIRSRIPREKISFKTPEGRKAALKSLAIGVGFGVLAGIGTHYVLVAIGERKSDRKTKGRQ